MGTAVIVAPWWNPVRLAHEISMLDILLKGRRLHLGIGRGIAPHEYASLGYPIEQSHKYFYDVINAIKAADGAERFEFHGEVYKIPPTTIRPQARHKGELTKRIKVAFTTKASAQLAAENGLGQMFVSGDNLDEMTDQVREFNQIRNIVRRMVGVREVASPEETILSGERNHTSQGAFIGITRDPALPAEVLARPLPDRESPRGAAG